MATVTIVEVEIPGLQGPPGPDPWADPVQVISHNGGSLTVNYALGKHVRLTLNGSATLTVTNWPANNKIARLTFEIQSAAAYSITWPGAVLWPGGFIPPITPGGRDLIVLATSTGGSVILGMAAGLNFTA